MSEKRSLISDAYRKLNEQMHAAVPGYGIGGKVYAKQVQALCDDINPDFVLDYGCGKATLDGMLSVPVESYDPSIPKYAAAPPRSKVVVVTDVLEHVEPDCLDAVLGHIAWLTLGQALFVISTRKARKKLPDGRNVHLIIKDQSWWKDKLRAHFRIVEWNHDKTSIKTILESLSGTTKAKR